MEAAHRYGQRLRGGSSCHAERLRGRIRRQGEMLRDRTGGARRYDSGGCEGDVRVEDKGEERRKRRGKRGGR